MASQNINVGSEANDNSGDPLRTAFINIRKNFAEIYGQSYSTDTQDLSGTSLAFKANQFSLTNTAEEETDGYVLTYDDTSGGFTLEQKFDGDITGIVAGNGLTGSSLDSGDATLNVVGGDGITANEDEIEVTVDDSTIELSASDGSGAIRIKDDGVDHDQLSARFTAAKTDYGSISTDTTIDWSVAAVHQLTMGGAATLNFSNYKKGQVIDLIIDGDETITLGTTSGTPSINQVGTSTYDGTTDNIIQVLCTDDDATPTFLYAVGAYTSDTNPA